MPSTINPIAVAGNAQVTLTWTAVEGATKYKVYYLVGSNTAVECSETTGLTYTVTGLSNGTRYGFYVLYYANGAWSTAPSTYTYATPSLANMLDYQGLSDFAAAMFRYIEGTYVRRSVHESEVGALATRVNTMYNTMFPEQSNNNS